MDRSRRFRGGMTGNSSWKRELLEELSQALFIFLNVGIKLRVGPLQVGIRHHPWPAVSGAADIDHVQVILVDQPVEVRINEVESGSRPPMPQQAGLDVLDFERLAQQRGGVEVNMGDGKKISRAPVGVPFVLVLRGAWVGRKGRLGGIGGTN